MSQRRISPYGEWVSPITSDLIVSSTISLGSALLDGADTYWLEGRPAEGGRQVVVKRTGDGLVAEVTPPPFNARTRVHEYGGGAVLIHQSATYFSNYADQRLYRALPGETPEPLTPSAPMRFADGTMDAGRGRIICIGEDHSDATLRSNGGYPANAVIAVSLSDGSHEVLVTGNDFYAAPRLSPDGSCLAWLTWNHPNMPWDGTELWVARIDGDGRCVDAQLVAGGVDESIFCPTWSPDGILTFVSDRTDWWNIYRWERDTVRCVLQMEAEFGLPQWVFGLATYAYVDLTTIVCIYTNQGIDHLALIDVGTGTPTEIVTPYTSLSGVATDGQRVVFRGGAPTLPGAIVAINLATRAHTVLRSTTALEIDATYLSAPESLAFPSEEDRTAYGLFYPPVNPDFAAPEGDRPPLIVFSHGGPTGATSSALSLGIQFWTSRGFAVLDVNYGGSTGYGRAYRNLLRDRWGIVDVDDCINGARHLVAHDRVDGSRLAIRGGSAGGYTTLSALAFRNVFHVGASHYGVGDLAGLARDTHKFESRYLDRLVGPYPERLDLYTARSPIHHIDGINCPVIFFQGLEDKVVPPAQAEEMVAALDRKGIPVAYLAFEGEQHGFRRADNIKRALDAELWFYGRIFGFEPADAIEPVPIRNLG
ncbi:MAG: S9 family peptidase [Anaerolineae bacterium]|jgi:dipeptidyl aminopeptidase/acylaminoacyl peptidase|nr:S9 family peptidase [Anaerolineae bacterium]